MENMSKLTEASACRKSREFSYVPKEGAQPENYFRTIIVKDTIRNALIYNVRDPKEVMQYMQSRFPECGFKNYQQMQQQLLWDHRRVMRYLKGECRKPSFPKALPVRIGDRVYDVHCDVAYECGDQVELVIFKVGKPSMTQTGRGNAFQRDMQLYALQLYGRELGFKNITSSFYFLRKSSDTSYWNQCEQNFFGGGDNIIQITDLYDGTPNELDRKMLPVIAKNDSGIMPENQEESTCEYCDKYDLCKYKLPPVRIETPDGPKEKAGDVEVHFSEQQKKAIGFESGIARIIAGAGSGKTAVVTERVAKLLREGTAPEAILMVTFTKAGAEEMKRRIEVKVGKELPGLAVSTFNAFEYEIVKDCWQELGFQRVPKVIDAVEQFAVIADLLCRKPIYEWSGRAFMNFSALAGWGNRGALRIAADVFKACKMSRAAKGSVDMTDARAAASYEEISQAALGKLVELYDEYEDVMKEKGLIDFDDQEILAFQMLENDPEYLREHYRFEHIIVDEYQDTSQGQIELLKRLRSLPTFKSLMVVGDDFQAVYGFRDTSPEYIINFEDYIGESVQDIILDRNFRSTPQICEFAAQILEPNQDKVEKDLVAVRPNGVPVIVNGFYAAKDEIKYIVQGIANHLADGTRPEDIAVLAYTKGELQKIADALTKEGIPSMFSAPEPLMENSRIRAILAFARVIRDTTDTKDALTAANALCAGGLMDRDSEEVEDAVRQAVGRAEMIRNAGEHEQKALFLDFIDEIALGDEAVEHFREGLDTKDYEEIIDYCRDFSLYGNGVEYRRTDHYPGVALVTAHSSKGLEWPVIYNTITKYQKGAAMSKRDVEETRRLLFVSATRARDELYITGLYANGTKMNKVENRFLKEIFDIAKKGWNYLPA